MDKRWIWIIVAVVVIAAIVAVVLLTRPGEEPAAGETPVAAATATPAVEEKWTLGLSLSTLNNPFFVTLKEGAEAAAKVADVELVVVDAQDDSAKEATNIEDLIQKEVDLLLVNPTDADAIVPSIEKANEAGIPVFTIDRGASGGVMVSHIASDNVAGGSMAGKFLCEALGGAGKVVELEGIAGTSAARDRGQGFNDYMSSECSGVEIVARQTANFNRAEGLSVFENILQAQPEIDGVFAHNDEMILGAIEAAEAADRTGIVFVGFDAVDDAVAAVNDGKLAATIAQQPSEMGRLGVEFAVKYLGGESVEEYVPVDLALVAGEIKPPEEVTLGLSLSTLNNPFFVTLKEGAEAAAGVAGIELVVVDAQDDSAKEATNIEDLIQKDVSALLINPTDADAIVPSIQKANQAGIPVFTIDRAASGGVMVSHIASDNVAGGSMAGKFLCEALGGAGKVVELEGIAGTSAARDRGQGFNDYMSSECSGVEIVARQTANFNRAEGLSVFENILQAQPEIDGVFAHNDEMILGAIEAAEAAGRTGIVFVGFDAVDDAVAAVDDGKLAATIAQQPSEMGRLGVEFAVKYLSGESVDTYVPVDLALVEGELPEKPPEAGAFTLGLSLSTLNNPFFVTLKEGAEAAAGAIDVELVVVDAQDDSAREATNIEDLIQKDVSALLINPTDADAIVPSIQKANEAGIPVFTIDRGAAGGDIVSHIASDNVAGGSMAGEFLCNALGGTGNVVELEGIAGTSAARDRGQGFNDYMSSECSGVEIVARQTANFNRAEGLSVFENILQAQPEIDGVFAHNDEMILGAIEAAEAAGRTGIVFVGFDAVDDAVAAVDDGKLAATIAQQPSEMGRLGVEFAAKYLSGESVEEYVPVDLALVEGELPEKPPEAGAFTLGLSLSTLNNPFFVTLEEGAEAAAGAAGVELVVVDAQDDSAREATNIEDLIQKDVSALLINPTDADAIVPSIQKANQAGIPVFTIDRGAAGGDIVSHIASDNVAGGNMAAEFLCEALGSAGNVVELEGIAGTSAARDRGQGFNDYMSSECSGVEIVARQTANFNRAEGLSVFENILQAQPEIDGVFAHNDEMILGAIEAAEAAGRAEEIVFVGFDAVDDAVAAVKTGKLAATVAQQPSEMGRLGVEFAIKYLSGESVDTYVPVDLALVVD